MSKTREGSRVKSCNLYKSACREQKVKLRFFMKRSNANQCKHVKTFGILYDAWKQSYNNQFIGIYNVLSSFMLWDKYLCDFAILEM